MARISKVTDPTKIVTDPELLRDLVRQGIDKDYVEFHEDYSTEHPGAKRYRDLKSGKRFMVVSGLPRVEDMGRKIEAGWLLAKGKYYSKANLFSVVVEGTGVLVSVKLNQATWNPQVFIDGVEQSCGEATLLTVDPNNKNYHNNVLEWDYGICVRRLRVIEGALLERWFVSENPNGEIRIKHNWQGELPLKLEGALGGDGNQLEAVVTDDDEIVPADSFNNAVYPVVIHSTLTVYSTSSDGGAYNVDTVYATAHDAANADTTRAGNNWTKAGNSFNDPNYVVERSFLYFDTSSLGADATISAATLSVYDDGNSSEVDAGHSDLGIVEGVQEDPFDTADYGDHLNKTTLGADTYYAYPLTAGDYTDKALNATGRGWINKTGTTKFCLRLKGDIDNSTPTGSTNETRIWANENGSGYQPKLVVTYTAPVEKTSSDSGSGSETLLSRAYVLPEVGAGLESLGSRLLGVVEEGQGAETLLARLLGSIESASGLDAGVLLFTSGDVGSGLDAILALEARLAGTDSGSGIDTSFLIKALLSSDSGLGTDAVAALLAIIVAGELMVGSDSLAVKIETAPKGGGMKLPPGGKTSIPSRRINL